MRKHRKTRAERNLEWRRAEGRSWGEFLPKLESLATFADARRVVDEAPPQDTPGRSFYSNLGFFLHTFAPPAGASGTELSLYIQFLQRIDAAGELKPGVKDTLIRVLQEARDAKRPL